MKAKLSGTGSYVPENIVRNDDLAQFPASARRLIAEKTGVLERRHAPRELATSDLAALAAERCLDAAKLSASTLDGIILATSSPDQPMPSTAAILQHKIGATNAFAFDINAVCTGAVYALTLAEALIASGRSKHVLVVASEIYSRILNPSDFATYPYFGDGAGAVLLTAAQDERGPFISDCILHSDGSGADFIKIAAGGSKLRFDQAEARQTYFQMNGRAVMEFTTEKGPQLIAQLIERSGVASAKIGKIFIHQANINIIRRISEAASIPFASFPINLDRYGNTAAASTLIALDEACDGDPGTLPSGLNLIIAFGGGLTWGGIAISN